jgi:negative regulator of flagellin synthesis FlgM
MINGVDNKGRVDAVRIGLDRAAPAAKVANEGAERSVGAPISAVAAMAAEGAPIDAAKVAAIRAAIAEGRYPIEPDRIAQGMIAFDFNPYT